MAKQNAKLKKIPCKHPEVQQITGTTAAWCPQCGSLSLSAEDRWRRPKATDGRSLRHRGNSTSPKAKTTAKTAAKAKAKAKTAAKAKAKPKPRGKAPEKVKRAAAPKVVKRLRRRKGGANGEVIELHQEVPAVN